MVKIVESTTDHLAILGNSNVCLVRVTSSPAKHFTPSSPICTITSSMSSPSAVGSDMHRYRTFPEGAPGISLGFAALAPLATVEDGV